MARNPSASVVRLSPDAARLVARSETLKWRLLEEGQPVYGVSTGFGDSVRRQIAPAKATELQRNMVQYHLNGVGADAPAEVVRATMLIRANCLARGYSGVRVELIERLLECLAADILPQTPEIGSVGASGDLVPLAYLANVLCGEGDVLHHGVSRTAAAALADRGMRPLELQPKEALAVINGTSFMAAFAALALADARALAEAAELCTALTVQVLMGGTGPFEVFVHEQKPHPGQVESASSVARMLRGSALARDDAAVLAASPALGDQHFQVMSQALQDRYSVRCAPHVIGVLRDTCDWVARWLTVEINSSNDNPLFDVDAEVARNGGNFYGGHVGQAMDSLKVAVASVGDLLDRQLELVVDEKFSNGLTPNLIPRFETVDHQAGLHHGYKGMQIACSALAAEALKESAPATVFSRSTEAHNQDKVSMGTIAARDARRIIELVQSIVAIHLHAMCQAADLRGAAKLSPATRVAYETIRAYVPFVDRDRRLDGDIRGILELLRSGALAGGILPKGNGVAARTHAVT